MTEANAAQGRTFKTWKVLGVGLLVLIVAYCVWFAVTSDDRMEAARTLAAHSYPAQGSGHLTEAQALEILPDMLVRAGLEPDDWAPYPDDRAAAPDGTPEQFLLRNTLNPNDAGILLDRRPSADGPGPKTPITLIVELKDGQVEARLWLNK